MDRAVSYVVFSEMRASRMMNWKPNVRTASPVKTQISSVSVLLPSFTSLGDVKPARCTLRAIPSLL